MQITEQLLKLRCMGRFAKRMLSEGRCASRNFSGQGRFRETWALQ